MSDILSLNLIYEQFIRLGIMLSLTAAFSGVGLLFTISFFKNSIPTNPVEHFGIALSIGLSFVILLVSGLSLFGIPLTKNNLSIALFISFGLLIIQLLKKKGDSKIMLSLSRHYNPIESLLPIILFFVLLLLRLIQIRDVFVPSWYSGLIHTSLLKEFANASAIPFNNVYPVGFPAIALIVYLYWDLTFSQAILLSSQWLSAVCGISFYIFARRYVHNAYASGLSFAAFSFMLLFPSALISWGRYPYLLGLTLMLPAILKSQDWINDSRKSSSVASFVLVISLGLTHYGSLLCWFMFNLVYLINKTYFMRDLRLKALEIQKAAFFRFFLLVFSISIVIFFKMLDPSSHNFITSNILSQPFDPDPGFGTQYIFRRFRLHDYFFILIWIFWIFWSVVWNKKLLYLTLFWPLAIWILTWIQYQFFGNSISTYANLFIFFSIPLSISLGLFGQQFLLWLIKLNSSNAQFLSRHQIKSRLSILLIIAIIVCVFSSPLSIDQNTALFTDEDLVTMRWISDHTMNNSGFLIRNIRWNNNILLPSDGGGWITYLTGRRTIIPQTGELYDVCDFAMDHGVNYIYFGRQRGYYSFDLRITDLNVDNYDVVYESQFVEIVSLRC